MDTLEMLAGRVWLPLRRDSGGSQCPQLPESSTLVLRGLNSGETALIGPLEATADAHGCVELRLSQTEELFGHLGLVEVCRGPGETVGEFEIVPDKMSEESYQTLRSALEHIWSDSFLILWVSADYVASCRRQLICGKPSRSRFARSPPSRDQS